MRGDSPLAAPHEERPSTDARKATLLGATSRTTRCRPRHGAVRDAVMTMVVRVADVADAGRMCAEDGGVTATVVVAMVTATVTRAGCGEVVVDGDSDHGGDGGSQ